ncbi:M48 family metallopeptidase [Wenzhouxiangella marina]|uniref:Uncharacterized protein n=1 Tax=Wenzhouxiangella marina TaxID=1579979 RepID=A0A0K0XTD9_9GAMM|nr:SprT family zinc-dependent metalloprotease [Wenzhouxiangella marina]AKS40925.1 hypothetical protein WM2015_543 [Wenzhouxiangella marina]MBB6087799.1 hypothetical protein [Wenzhouxiangella marina]
MPYTLRVHPRARRVKLRVDERGELLVTVPRAFDTRRLPELIDERRHWIESVRRRQASLRAGLDEALQGPRPARIELPALDECWRVDYRSGRGERLTLQSASGRLRFTLPSTDPDELDARVRARLRDWLRARAREALAPQVDDLAREHGFRYRSIGIRNQRSRWGSCSAAGRLSLNARVLFASPEACRYVLVHELVHTRHLDHSPAFWARVAEIDPDYRAHMRQLDRVWRQLPDWV